MTPGTAPSLSAAFVILCVDDDPAPLSIRKLVLERVGYRVIPVLSGKDALEILRKTNVDLVLSDQLMPEMLGTDLAVQVKNAFPEVAFVLLSGVNELPPGAEAADLFMSKLEGPEVMIDNIASLLRR